MWFGEMISSIGSGLSAFGIGILVFQMTSTATSVSLVTFFSFVPAIVLSPVAGVLADRYNRRTLMIVGDLFSALVLLVMWFLMINTTIQIWQICLCIGLNSVFVSLIDPCYRATVTDLLSEEEYSRASGLIQLASSAKFLLAPLAAGFLLTFVEVSTLVMFDICTVFLTIITLYYVKKTVELPTTKIKNKNHVLADLKSGWQVIHKQYGVLVLLLIMSTVTFFIGFIETLFTPMLLSYTSVQVLGTIQSIGAIGMLVSSVFIGIFNLNKHLRRNMIICLALAGIFIILIGSTTNVIVIGWMLFLFFFTLPFINTGIDVLIRGNIPNEAQGRVWGIVSVISQLGYVFAYATSGILADYVFNPLLKKEGILAESFGKIIGVGPSRGIGLLFMILGLGTIILSCCLWKSKEINRLEKNRLKKE
ncbi:hypothetical protein ATZ33_00130 [Enterococcus silesiacus]|nr:MFS transporter [Enterococcus silesiacus]ALR99844.1 hypothetical protein ATZ33_00130 [Enterococcus silesiacus]